MRRGCTGATTESGGRAGERAGVAVTGIGRLGGSRPGGRRNGWTRLELG
ncbi:hypothetical protein AZ78_0926 [Lysobacter capsici AZ78]|uniref:Uncharacterized protein n=1 Tax=Lysobacter capsici AZ78 TaxID=1444315 RepID=A0A120AFP8_9GAMM|nr:hypothetical protein AZ78_0926 [Lysobacter capsici AZ78]